MKVLLKILFVLFFLISAFFTQAQEYVTGLGLNEQVADQWKKTEVNRVKHCGCKGEKSIRSLMLPFFDDFTASGVYPVTDKWQDKDVFVNQGFPFRSVNHGVATFDALNSKGEVYKNANWVTFIADHLTSLPIRLDSVFLPVPKKLTVADSLYFSFFYQPQGRGDEPEEWDSLVLQFAYKTGDTIFDHMDSIEVLVDYYLEIYGRDTLFPGDTLWAPSGCNPEVYTINYTFLHSGDWVMVACDSVMIPEIKWKTVWYAPGMNLLAFQKKYKTNFKQIMIPLVDTNYFCDAFQFRFLNYASIANDIVPGWKSNCDQWNIDFVYLNYNRSKNDTTYEQTGFTDDNAHFLKHYLLMPYRQYRADAFNSVSPEFKIYYSNLDSVAHNVQYHYKVKRVGQINSGYQYVMENFDLPPYFQINFADTLPPWQLDTIPCNNNCATVPVTQYFDLDYNTDTMSYNITHYITAITPGGSVIKDSIKFHQGFYNYYAYDDGIPELGYGLEPSGAQCAYKFSVNTADTLQGVQIYFNRTLDNANEQYFKLKVWRDNNGKPGEVAYEQENMKVAWNNGQIYGYYYYPLQQPVLVSGKFYVGWEQYQNGSLNIGFDANNDARKQIFYTEDNEWHVSGYHGALMIRPVVGKKGFVGEIEYDNKPENFNVYPNPANSYFKFSQKLISFNSEDYLAVYNLLGVEIISKSLKTNTVDVSKLSSGVYLVKIIRQGKVYTSRLLIYK